MEDFTGLIIAIYFLAHFPAFIMLLSGFTTLKKNPAQAKTLFIIAGVYFVIGGGICGKLLGY